MNKRKVESDRPVNTNKLVVARGEVDRGLANGWRGVENTGLQLLESLSPRNKRHSIENAISGIVIVLYGGWHMVATLVSIA